MRLMPRVAGRTHGSQSGSEAMSRHGLRRLAIVMSVASVLSIASCDDPTEPPHPGANAGYVVRAQRILSLYAPGVGTAR